jgi:hypothetical protein
MKKTVKKLAAKLNGNKRICKCGKGFRYSGKGRPFARCPSCRKEK